MTRLLHRRGLRRLTRTRLRNQLDAARQAEAAARARITQLEADLATAVGQWARLCEEKARGWRPAPLPPVHVPAPADVAAELGEGDYLDDTDQAWTADHATASETTQEIDVTTLHTAHHAA